MIKLSWIWPFSKFPSSSSSTTASTTSTTTNISVGISISTKTFVSLFLILSTVALSSLCYFTDNAKETYDDEIQKLKRGQHLLQQENRTLKKKVALFEGSKEELENLTIRDCEHYETIMKSTLQNLEQRKTKLLKNEIESEKGNRLCVICQEKDKSVLLLPCRHLCLCESCSSSYQTLSNCPLCRNAVTQRLSIFA